MTSRLCPQIRFGGQAIFRRDTVAQMARAKAIAA